VSVALLAARLLLAVVFLVAGLGKLADTAGSRRAVEGFGVPRWVATPIGTLLPLAELAVAVALVAVSSAWWGAVGAVVLLGLFIVAIAVNLALGRSPDCHCFGQVHSAPTGPATLLRNGVLCGVGVFVVAAGSGGAGASAWGWGAHLPAGEWVAIGAGVAVSLLFAGTGWLLLSMLGQNGRLLLRVEALERSVAQGEPAPVTVERSTGDQPQSATAPAAGLPVGAPAPAFELEGLDGQHASLSQLQAEGRPLVLLFTNPGCGPCTGLMPEIARWQREHAGAVSIVLVSEGSVKANRAKAGEHGVGRVLLQKKREVADAYRVPGTPSGVLITPQGAVAGPLAAGPDAIRALIATATAAQTLAAQPALAVIPANGHGNANGHRNGNGQVPAVPPGPATPGLGDPAPAFTLPDLAGRQVALADLRGKRMLVLFWNPGCGFCQRMLDDLKAYESTRQDDQPELLMVSRGSVQANQAMGLRAPVLLDDSFAVAHSFGARGTPSAVIIDEQGNIASLVAVGAEPVLNLAGHPAAPRNSR